MKKTKGFTAFILAVVMITAIIPSVSAEEIIMPEENISIPVTTRIFNGHTYSLYDMGLTWNAAKLYCESLGGYLATITSQEEQDFIETLTENAARNYYWLGGTDEETEGIWKWITGETFTYNKWSKGNPNNGQPEGENYTAILAANKWQSKNEWNDFSDNGSIDDIETDFGFICEWGDIETDGETTENQEDIDIVEDIINNSIILKIGSPKALVNGEVKQIDENNANVFPFVDENSRTLVPVRFIAENFGYNVEYEPLEKKITILNLLNYNNVIKMSVGTAVIEADNQNIIIDTAPIITPDGRTVIPLRAFVETGLKKEASYVADEKIIIISGINLGGDNSEMALNITDKIKESFYIINDGENGPVWPLDMSKVTRELKNWPHYTDGTYHAGADFAIPLGNDVYASYSGVVDTVRDLGKASYGKYIVIKSTINNEVRHIYYAHLSKQIVEVGDTVKAGQKIGESGNTGNSEGPHLHYEVRDENKHYGSLDNPTLNPYAYLPK